MKITTTIAKTVEEAELEAGTTTNVVMTITPTTPGALVDVGIEVGMVTVLAQPGAPGPAASVIGMTTLTYDPTSVAGDAFDMDNMVEGVTNKILTAAERSKLSLTSGTNTGDQDLSGKEDVGIASGLVTAHETAHPVPTNRDTRNQLASLALDNVSGVNTGDQDLSGKEDVGVAAGLDAAHLVDFNHTQIAHTNRTALNNVSGINTGDQDLSGKEDAGTAASLYNVHLIAFNHSAITHINRTALDNVSGVNTGDQDLSGKEDVGVAAGLVATHAGIHPPPDVRDTRNAAALGVDDNYVTDAEKVVIGNTSGINTGDQDLTSKEDTGVAAGLMTSHTSSHPPPTTRDARNQVAGSYEAGGAVAAHELAHPVPTDRDTRNQIAGSYETADATILKEADVDDTPVALATTVPVSSNWAATHLTSHPVPTDRDVRNQIAGSYEPADATILKDADIGTSVQAYSTALDSVSGVNTGDQDLSGKQDNITLTTTGTSGAATLVGSALNIPQYSGAAGSGVTEGDVVALVIALG